MPGGVLPNHEASDMGPIERVVPFKTVHPHMLAWNVQTRCRHRPRQLPLRFLARWAVKLFGSRDDGGMSALCNQLVNHGANVGVTKKLMEIRH